MIVINKAGLADIDTLVSLFDGYRVFYRQPSDLEEARRFLTGIMTREEAVIFLAIDDHGRGAGFTLLYPSYSSVSMTRIFVLNDLFVHPTLRQKGIATALLDKAVSFGREKGAIRLHLETEVSNVTAQALYEKEGWVKELESYHYNYTI